MAKSFSCATVRVLKSGDDDVSLSATSYLEHIFGKNTGRPPLINLEKEKLIQLSLRELAAKNLITSAHDISDGGLAIALAESCINSGLGAKCNILTGNQEVGVTLEKPIKK